MNHMKRLVLLVDDNLIHRKVMSQVLSGFPVSIIEAGSGEQAIELVHSHTFDIILMDVVMPRMDGYEAAELIRESDVFTEGTPIVAVTADNRDDTIKNALLNGMDGAIAKPLNKESVQTLFTTLFGEEEAVLFDIAAFESFYDDPGFRLDIIDTVMEDKDQDKKDLERAFASQSCDTIYKKVHYLKGSFSYLKSKRMVDISQSILDACKESNVDKATSFKSTYLETFEQFLSELTDYVSNQIKS